MQTEIALSSTESEYTGMSYGLREVIPIMEILKEMKAMQFPVTKGIPKVHCRVFEDKELWKWRLRTNIDREQNT